MIDLNELREKYESMMNNIDFSNYRYVESMNCYMLSKKSEFTKNALQWVSELNFGWRVFQKCHDGYGIS